MGGNLYKVGRVSKERYLEIINVLKPILDKHFGNDYRIPIAYTDKADYGDADIILNATPLQNKEWLAPLIAEMSEVSGEEVKLMRIRNVYSTLFMNFQVDFFLVGVSRFESTYHFMSYNILGNLLGRIFHKFNLKYGEDGLKYVFRGFNDRVSKEIFLSTDMKEILEFIELDYNRWLQGFKNREEIYEYIIGCKYFCANSYDLKYFDIRKRATERPDFNAFIDYLGEKKIDKNFPFEKPRENYIPFIESKFPTSNLQEKYNKHVEDQKIAKELHDKFNGHIIMGVLGITDGKAVGTAIHKFKEAQGNSFQEFILKSSQEEINTKIKEVCLK